jgi:hypothetical protein
MMKLFITLLENVNKSRTSAGSLSLRKRGGKKHTGKNDVKLIASFFLPLLPT